MERRVRLDVIDLGPIIQFAPSDRHGSVVKATSSLSCTHRTKPFRGFRGKPAISDLGWPFTPSHKSSPYFATYVGSVLQGLLELSSTCSWLDRSVSGQIGRTIICNLLQAPTPNGLSRCSHFLADPSCKRYAVRMFQFAKFEKSKERRLATELGYGFPIGDPWITDGISPWPFASSSIKDLSSIVIKDRRRSKVTDFSPGPAAFLIHSMTKDALFSTFFLDDLMRFRIKLKAKILAKSCLMSKRNSSLLWVPQSLVPTCWIGTGSVTLVRYTPKNHGSIRDHYLTTLNQLIQLVSRVKEGV
ncbi:mitochondrial protein [Striga asiatica]|uniref:Mitochondrial protein n=1 Tax=Striga asiatica TaxID=4170 RepID=A0A5A7Q1W2_STRAF|nr:mitochondrial protein [Striga asiatica]